MLSLLFFVSCGFSQPIESCGIISKGIVLTMYYQPWCGHSIRYQPTMQKIADNAAAKGVPITIQKVNCSKCNCDSFGVKGYPTTVLRENGIELSRKSGNMDCTTVGEFLNQNLCESFGQLTNKKGLIPSPVVVQPIPVQIQPTPNPVPIQNSCGQDNQIHDGSNVGTCN